MATTELPFNAADWTATVGGIDIPWTQLEVTFEQFHVPAKFGIVAPLEDVQIPVALKDKSPEVIIRFKGKEFFVGVLTDSVASGNDGDSPEDEPEDMITFTGHDQSERLVRAKVVSTVPQNLTSSEIVKQYCREAGLTDFSQVTPTTEYVGHFIRHNYSTITKGLNKHRVIFDLAELEHFVFRIHGRRVFFGPQPEPKEQIRLRYRRDFNQFTWRKSHNNEAVKITVLSWSGKKKRVAQTVGDGDLVIQKVVPNLTQLQAKALAIRLAEEAERGLLSLDIQNVPGVASIDDITFAFYVTDIAKGIDQVFWPRQIRHVITQDDHVMDLSLYNAKRIMA